MSLINDALKKAQETRARDTGATTTAPALVPAAEPIGAKRRFAPLAAVLALGIFGFGLWWGRSHGAHGVASPQSPAVAVALSAPADLQQAKLTPRTSSTRTERSPAAPQFSVAASPALESPLAATKAKAKANVLPQVAAVPKPAPAKPPVVVARTAAPLNLEAIHYRLKKASVRINGETLFAGDQVAGAKVLSIKRESVQLLVGGKTNVLKLL